VLVLAATVLGVPGSVVAIIDIVDGGEQATSSSPKPGRGERIAACQARHRLSRIAVWRDASASPDSTVIASCSWPPKPWTEPDGYAELAFSQKVGPGDGEATGATLDDHLRQPNCGRFALTYEVTQTGANQLQTNEVPTGAIVTPYGDEPAMETPIQVSR
jgi:hypothetical protein